MGAARCAHTPTGAQRLKRPIAIGQRPARNYHTNLYYRSKLLSLPEADTANAGYTETPTNGSDGL